MRIINVIPVPAGWTVEQAWEHVRRGHLIPEELAPPEGDTVCPRGGYWALVESDDDGNFVGVRT